MKKIVLFLSIIITSRCFAQTAPYAFVLPTNDTARFGASTDVPTILYVNNQPGLILANSDGLKVIAQNSGQSYLAVNKTGGFVAGDSLGNTSIGTNGFGDLAITDNQSTVTTLQTDGFGSFGISDKVSGNGVIDASPRSFNYENTTTANYVATIDSSGRFTLSTSDNAMKVQLNGDLHGNIKSSTATFVSLPVYSDNAAALIGGLTAGQVYRSGDDLKIVH